MENFLLTCNVILPLCLPMVVGYFVREKGMLPPSVIPPMNKLSYKILIPALLFCNIYESDIESMFDGALILYTVGATLLNYLILWLVFGKAEQDPRRRGAIIHGTFRGNTALFGIPIAEALLGPEGGAVVAVAVGAVIPLYNVLAILTLELCRGGKPSAKHIAREILLNPLILCVFAGLLCSYLRLPIPDMLYFGIKNLANIATPLAFVLLGASFRFSAAAHNRKTIALVSALKLIAMPIVWCGLGVLLGWRGASLVALLAVFGPPTAVTSYPMAEAMGGDAELAGEIVAITSVAALFSMFCFLFFVKSTGLV